MMNNGIRWSKSIRLLGWLTYHPKSNRITNMNPLVRSISWWNSAVSSLNPQSRSNAARWSSTTAKLMQSRWISSRRWGRDYVIYPSADCINANYNSADRVLRYHLRTIHRSLNPLSPRRHLSYRHHLEMFLWFRRARRLTSWLMENTSTTREWSA